MKKRILSLVLTLCMLVELLPASVLAADTLDAGPGVHCVHVHDESCGFVEAVAEQPCGHVHDEACGYAAPGEGTPCAHVHDKACGWAPAVEGHPCNHVCTVESGCLDPEPEPAPEPEADPAGPETDESLEIEVEEPGEALYDAGYSVVLTLPGEWDSYDWQLWSGEEEGWTSLEVADPTLPLAKGMFVCFAFRCVVEKDGVRTASAPYAFHEEALTAPLGSGVDTLAWGEAAFKAHWKDSDYIAVAPARYNGYCFDVYGVENGSDYKTTYMNGGYTIASQVDGTKVGWKAAPDTDVSMGGSLTGRFAYDIVYGGRYVKITYTVKNNGSTEKTFQVGSSGDVMIDQNDRAEVRGTAMGLQMDDRADKKFNLVVPTATTKWFGFFNKAYGNMFTAMNETQLNTPYSGDSGMAWSWTGTVKPGKTWTRYALIGVGEMPPPLDPPTISIELADGKDFVAPGETFPVSGAATGASVVYIDVGGKEYKTTVAAGGSFTAQAAVPEDAPEGPLEIRAWAVNDANGAMSETVSATVNVKHAPAIELTTPAASVMEDESPNETWYKGFIKRSHGDVSHTSVDAAKLGTQTVTYTAHIDDFDDAEAALTVTVLPLPAELGQAAAPDKGDKFDLSAEMLHTGGLTYTETGFVYGAIQNPTLTLKDGQVKTAGAVSTKGGTLSASVPKAGLTPAIVYYARAYAIAGDGTVVYGPQSAGFGLGIPQYGTFSIKNNGDNTFTIYRDPNQADGEQKVYYRTVNGSAVGSMNDNEHHFRHTDGVLTFAAGEESRTVTVTEHGPNAEYSGAATKYANADRTYQMEIHRVEGGAVIGTRFATRNMGHDSAYTVDRNVYTTEHSGGQVTPSSSVYWVADHSGGNAADIWFVSDRGKNSDTEANYSFTYKPTYNAYLQNTITGWLYRYSINAHETENGYEHVWVGNQAPTNMGSSNNKVAGDGAAIPLSSSLGTALFTGSFEMWEGNDLTVKVPQVGCGVADACDGRLRNANGTGNMKTVGSNSYLVMGKDDTAYCYFAANGGGSEYWYIKNHTSYDLPVDTREPQLIDVAYMARNTPTCTYLPGDPITISLVFDEIVDKVNSSLSSSSTITVDGWGTFNYAGGADTNVLYFTGTTPDNPPTGSGNLKVTLNCAGQIKDMCDTDGSAASGTNTTTAQVGTHEKPTVNVGDISNKNGTLTSTITATDAAKLEYVWTTTPAAAGKAPAAGWRMLANTSSSTVTTRQTSGVWYLYARATNADGQTAVAYKSYDFTTGSGGGGTVTLPALTANVTNSAWARQRTITLTKTPAGAAVTVKTPGGTTASVSGTTYTATANGVHTFTMTVDGETYTAMATVSKLDRTAPTVTIDALDSARTYVQPVTLTVRAADSESGLNGKPSGTWVNGSTTIPATFTGADGVYTTTSPGQSGNWTLSVTAKDNVGWTKAASSSAYTLNLNLPTVTVTKGTIHANGSVDYTYSVNPNGQTIQTVQLPDGTLTTDLTGSFTLTSPGTYYVVVTDTAGHLVRSNAMTVTGSGSTVDGEPPEVRLSQDTEEWVNATTGVTVTVNAYDNVEVTKAAWSAQGGRTKAIDLTQDAAAKMGNQAKKGSFKVTANGIYTVTVWDGKNNTASTEIEITNIDPTAPTIGAPSGNPSNWTANNATISFKVTDAQSGVNTVTAKKDGTTAVTVTNNSGSCSFTATENGDYVITAADAAGNTATQTVKVEKIDKTTPTLSVIGGATAAASLNLTVTAANSGLSGVSTTVQKDGGAAQTVTDGKYTVNAAGTYVFTAATGAGLTKSQTVDVYSVTFEENGGSAVTGQIVVSGGKVAQPTTTRTGYTPSGWKNGNTAWNFSTSTVTANTTLTAQWTLNAPAVTVTADPTDGTAAYTGDTVVTLTANPSHAVAGVTYTYQWYKDGEAVTDAFRQTLDLTDAADSGSYTVKVTASDGTLTSAEGESAATAVTISQAVPELSELSATTIIYGQPLSASIPTGTARDPETNAALSGTWRWTASDAAATYPTVVNDSGKTEYSVTFTPDDANYGPTTAAVTLTVDKATLTPSVAAVENKVYDGKTDAAGTVKLTGAVLSDQPTAEGTFAFSSADVLGDKTVTVTGIALTGEWGGNYTLSTTDLSATATTAKITPKPVTLTWSGDKDLIYSGRPVNVIATAGDLVGSDTCSVTVTGGDAVDAGTHTAAATALSNPNYKLPDVVTRQYVIGPKPIVLHWHNMIQTYTGGDLTPKAVARQEDAGSAPAVTLVGLEGQDSGLDGLTVSVTRDGKPAAPVAAGSYTVTGRMDGGGNYTVTGSAALTIQKAPVSFAITGNSMKQGEARHGAVITPSPAGVPFIVTYKNQNGEVVDPAAEDLKAGSYAIWVELTDDNYRHAGSTDGKAAQLGVFTVYAQTPPPKYAVKFDAEDPKDETDAGGSTIGELTGETASLAEAEAGTLRTLPGCGYTCIGYAFAGWKLGGKVYPAGAAYTQQAREVTFTAQWVKAVHTVEGVVDQDGKPVCDVQVTLMLGSRKIAERYTDGNGTFRFENVAPGLYNLVASKDGVTMTVEATIVDRDEERHITLPTHKTNSIVEVVPGTPDVVVGNLEENFTEEDKALAALQESTVVEYKFTVEQVPENESSPEQQEIQKAAGSAIPALYLDLMLEKTVTVGDETSSTDMDESIVLLKSVIPLPAGLQGKYRYSVVRCHGEGEDAKAEALTTSKNADGEYIEVSADKTTLTVWAKKFSTYAVAYTDPPAGGGPSGGGFPAPGSPTVPGKPTIQQPEHGKIEITPSGPKGGDKVEITVTPDDGYEVDQVIVTDENGKSVEVTQNPDGTYTYTQPRGKVTISASLKKSDNTSYTACPKDSTCPIWPYTDASATAWYHDGVHYCIENGLMTGYGNNTFGPGNTLTRAMLAQIIYNKEGRPAMSGSNPFDDVDGGAWYAGAVAWGARNGVLEGYGNGKFGPGDPITREQLATMLWRYAGGQESGETLASFADGGMTSSWAAAALCWAVEQGIVTGKGHGILDPTGTATRAEAATMLQRFCTLG